MKKKYFISKTVMFVLISVILAGQTQIQTYAQNTTQQADAAYRNILKSWDRISSAGASLSVRF